MRNAPMVAVSSHGAFSRSYRISLPLISFSYSGVTLNCKHQCPSKCHAIVDHSKMRCTIRLNYVCKFNHKKVYACADGPPQACPKCEKEIQEEKKRAKLRQEERERIEQEQRAHERELKRIDKEIEAERQAQRDTRIRAEQQDFLHIKLEELQHVRAGARRTRVARKPEPSSKNRRARRNLERSEARVTG